MRTLTELEIEYLLKLIDRNYDKSYKGSRYAPLEIPMPTRERQLRSKIRKKIEMYCQDFTLFCLSGVDHENLHVYRKEGLEDPWQVMLQSIEPKIYGMVQAEVARALKKDS